MNNEWKQGGEYPIERMSNEQEVSQDSLSSLIARQSNPELIKKYEESLRDVQKVLEENNRLRREGEEQKRIIHELSYDSITDLKIRSLFYKQLNTLVSEEIATLFGEDIAMWETLPLDQLTERISNLDISNSENTSLALLMGDVAYLSLANTSNHALGDELLKNIGKAGKTTSELFPNSAEFFRYGGDEIVGVLRAESESGVKNIADSFESEVSQTPFAHLETLGITPHLHVDIGTSRFSEGFSAFRNLLVTLQEENKKRQLAGEDPLDIPCDDRRKVLIDMWLGIADEKSILRKAERRLPTLKFYKENTPDVYTGIIGSMRKGALNVTDEELDVLSNDLASIRQFIVEKRLLTKTESEKTLSRRNALVNGIIYRIATDEFLSE